MDPELKAYELVDVKWREYDFKDRVYRIHSPVKFWWKPGATTHRVLDSAGVVHIVPAPGIDGCVLRYKKINGADPCTF